MSTQGKSAVESGEKFEDEVVCYIGQKMKIPVYKSSEWLRRTGQHKESLKRDLKNPSIDKDKPVILEQHRYIGVFGPEKRSRRDIVIMLENAKYEIELKFQGGAGSTDEKVIYAFNCLGISDCDVGIVCVDGDYWYEKEYRIKGLQKSADWFSNQFTKEIFLFTLPELKDYINNITKEIAA